MAMGINKYDKICQKMDKNFLAAFKSTVSTFKFKAFTRGRLFAGTLKRRNFNASGLLRTETFTHQSQVLAEIFLFVFIFC